MAGINEPTAFQDDTFWGDNIVMWKSEIAEVIKSDFDSTEWEKCCQLIRNKYANVGGLNKNCLFIADTLEASWNDGKKSKNLEKLCNNILEFANP